MMRKVMGKTRVRRRLVVLLAGVTLLAVTAGGFYAWRQRHIRANFVRLRDEGLAAAGAGDDAGVVDKLGRYLQRYPDDADALTAYVRSRPKIADPQNGHLRDTIIALRHLLQLQPGRSAERRTLLDLYARTGYLTEALDTATLVLAQDPRDVKALRAKCSVLEKLRRFDDALAAANDWVAVEPADLEAHMARLWLMHEAHRPSPEILTAAEGLAKTPPGDPSAELLRGFGYMLTDNRESAIASTRLAAKSAPADEKFTKLLVAQFDGLGLSDESLAALEHLYEAERNSAVRVDLAKRYWEMGRPADVVKLFTGVSPTELGDGQAGSADVLAIYGWALVRLGRTADVAPVRAALAARGGDPVAAAWLLILDHVLGRAPVDPNRLFEACKSALDRDPADAYLRYFMGEAYASLGENELAVVAWQRAAEQDRAWATPLVRMADVLATSGRYESGLQAAQEGWRRAPHSATAVVVMARVLSIGLDNGRYTKLDELLRLVTEVQQQLPNEEQTLGIKVALLARTGKIDEARKAVTDAMAAKAPLAEGVLLHLAAVSRTYKLGVEEICFNRSQQDHGVTAALAFARAADRFAAGSAAEGAALFASLRTQANSSDGLEWKMAWARYLEAVQDPRAKAALIALADEQPRNLQVQQLALAAQSPRDDRPFVLRTVQRVRELTGEQGLAWRIGRARWLLDGKSQAGNTAETDEAIDLLSGVTRQSPDLTEARVLLAKAYERAHKITEAIEQLQTAEDLNPNATTIGLYRARLLQSRGDFERAREQLERVAAVALPDAQQRRQAAVLYAQQGESQKAIDLLEEANRQVSEQGTEDLLLAELYRQRNEPQKAEAICRKLLEKPSVAVIQFASDLLATQGRRDEAQKVLAQLDHVQLEPGVRELVLADYSARYVSLDAGTKLYVAATHAAPKNPATWRALMVCHLAAGRASEALAANEQGLRELPEDPVFLAVKRQTALLESATKDPALRPLVASYVRDPADGSAAFEVLRTVSESRSNKQSPTQLAQSLARLAGQFPRFLPLQTLLASAWTDAGHFDEAIAAAARAGQIAPGSPEPYRLQFVALRAAGRWAEALDAARNWRDRPLSDPLLPDLAIAEADLALNQPAAALQQLEPYTKAPDSPAYASVLPIYARARQASGQSGVAAMMEPLLAKGAAGRRTWLVFAAQNLNGPEAAVWLDRAAAAIPPGADEEQIVLAEAWSRLADRTADHGYAARGRAVLKTLTDKPSPSLMALVAMGVRCQQDSDLAAAEGWYRRAMAAGGATPEDRPESLIARNNLASVIAERGGDLNEARGLVQAALKLRPGVPALYDTLAAVEGKAKNYEEAVSDARTAVRLQPDNIGYRVSLAQLLADSGRPGQARDALREINELHPDLDRLSPDKRHQLEQLRSNVLKVADGAGGS